MFARAKPSNLTVQTNEVPCQPHLLRDQRNAADQRPPAGLPARRRLESDELQARPMVAGQFHPLDTEQPAVSHRWQPWAHLRTYQYQGGVRNPDGTTPRRSEYTGLVADAESGTTHNSAVDAAETELEDFVGYDNKSRLAASNLFKAHKQAVGASRAAAPPLAQQIPTDRRWTHGLFRELFPPRARSWMERDICGRRYR